MRGILGRKAGMTHLFSDNGKAIPVTVIEVLPNTVMQVKTIEQDGYNSIKLGYRDKKDHRATKPELGAAKKANTSAKYFEAEIKNMDSSLKIGDKVNASIFKSGELVDVIGTSKGRGFAGTIKRHHQSRGPESHGSKFHRSPGSLGSISGQVFKTKKLPGRLGGISSTQLNLSVIAIDEINNAIMIKGSIPGPNLSYVIIREAHNKIKKGEKVNLVDVKIEKIKNELIIEAKHVGANVNSSMSIDEMKQLIETAAIKHQEEIKLKSELASKADSLGIVNSHKMNIADLEKAIRLAEQTIAKRLEKEKADAEIKAQEQEKGKEE